MTSSSDKKIARTIESLLADLGSDASRRGYRSDWTFFVAWLRAEKVPVLKVSPKDVKRYVLHLADEGKAQRTRGRALSVIREVYRALVAEELLKFNPAREIKNTKRGKASKPVTWLEEDQLARLLSFGNPTAVGTPVAVEGGRTQSTRGVVACDVGHGYYIQFKDGSAGTYCYDVVKVRKGKKINDRGLGRSIWTDRRDRMCVQLLAGTGRRRSEIARMRAEDFDEGGVTGIVKGGSERSAPVPSWLRRELSEWLAFAKIESGPVLPRSPEDPSAVNGDGVYLIVKRVARACGIEPEKISPHGLRRTLATLSERWNVPLRDLQIQLNHRNIATTELYLKGSRKVEVAPGEWMAEMVRPT